MLPTGSEAQALGHLGNYHYFIPRGQHREALREAYSCTEKFPALGVQVLPEDLFSKPYRFLWQHAVGQDKAPRRSISATTAPGGGPLPRPSGSPSQACLKRRCTQRRSDTSRTI